MTLSLHCPITCLTCACVWCVWSKQCTCECAKGWGTRSSINLVLHFLTN
ncbi:hypothetical protein GBAR_LOCUS29358 [Geodia barretti]|uniref:Uncharacterized protein n=1 Tax=Geodia barretti TaxID=519541 RepID=A0AA35TSL7_GEOBA|nr:hypothetical protein GBAR_LOCUS29358 [Geodia barretti]